MKRTGLTRRAFVALPALAAPAILGASPAPAFRRGVGVYHIAGSSNRLRPDHTYVEPFFSGPLQQMADSEMRRLARAGFDFVRLLVAPDLPMRTSGAERAQLETALLDTIHRFKAAGLKTVIDLHSSRALPGYADVDLIADPRSPLFERYEAAVAQLARLASTADADVALELFNEPPGYSAAEVDKWAVLQARLHDSARTAGGRIPLVLTGARGGSKEGLLAIDPRRYRGSNLYWSFHYYDPHVFTHQGAEQTRYADLQDVRWPPKNRPALLSMAAAAQARNSSAAPYLLQYAMTGRGAEDVKSDMKSVSGWAGRYGVPANRILMGEFGVTRRVGDSHGAPESDRLDWLSTVRQTAEQAGFAWAYWCYSGLGGMALANEYPARTLDDATLTVLGLRAQHAAA